MSGIDGSEMYTNCGFWWWWIWGGDQVGLGGDACLGPKLGIAEVELLRAMTGRVGGCGGEF